MNDADRRLWPFDRRASLLTAAGLLAALLILFGILRASLDWPSARSENVILIGILLLSLLPIALAILDVIVERGGVVEAGGIKVDFSQSREMGTAGIKIVPNIGVRGQPVRDNIEKQFLDTLKQATASDVVIIDLEGGQAWWETRLLILLAAAERFNKPDKIVFVGTDARQEQRFQGWSYASDLMPRLVKADSRYERSLQAARLLARQLELAAPPQSLDSDTSAAADPAKPAASPAESPWLSATAKQYRYVAFGPSGLLNELFAEHLLQKVLEKNVEEKPEGPRSISLVRLEELFRPVLHKERIDLSWPADHQLDKFFETEAPFFAITQDGKYLSLVSRLTFFNQLLKPLVRGRPR